MLKIQFVGHYHPARGTRTSPAGCSVHLGATLHAGPRVPTDSSWVLCAACGAGHGARTAHNMWGQSAGLIQPVDQPTSLIQPTGPDELDNAEDVLWHYSIIQRGRQYKLGIKLSIRQSKGRVIPSCTIIYLDSSRSLANRPQPLPFHASTLPRWVRGCMV